MNNTYTALVKQTFNFPQEGFDVGDDGYLEFNGLDLKPLIEKYGTPMKLTYLPKIGQQINKVKKMFASAIKKHKYDGDYFYCYCTKSSHFSFVIEEALKHDIHLETSYAYDIEIINKLYERKKISKDTFIICNGYKQKPYTSRIAKLINSGFRNVIPILDNIQELEAYRRSVKEPFKLGIRIAAEEEPSFPFYTSRLGFRAKDILEFYVDQIEGYEHKFQLKMLHIFLNKGIKDDIYYWSELNKIKKGCKRANVPMPNIYTEFGSYTVGESMAHIYSVIGQKMQNDREIWYMIDSSLLYLTHGVLEKSF